MVKVPMDNKIYLISKIISQICLDRTHLLSRTQHSRSKYRITIISLFWQRIKKDLDNLSNSIIQNMRINILMNKYLTYSNKL